jgi:hypothetical protein
LNSSKIERKILGLGKNLFWKVVPDVELALVSNFHWILSTIAQGSSFGRKGQILGGKISSSELPLDFVSWEVSAQC